MGYTVQGDRTGIPLSAEFFLDISKLSRVGKGNGRTGRIEVNKIKCQITIIILYAVTIST